MTRIAHLGPAGTFAEAAVRASPRTPPDAELVPQPTLHANVVAVQEATVDLALVPVENALEGAVNATLDALAFDAPDVSVIGEEVLPVRHNLLARRPLDPEDIEVVISHPQATAQCQAYLRREIPGAQVLTAPSTAEAVRLVVAEEGPWAAIGTLVAAKVHGAAVLAEGIEDDPGNSTRFVWLAPTAAGDSVLRPDPRGRAAAWKTSLLFGGDGDGRPGWLVRCLGEFAAREVNLNKIESRPSRVRLGHYVFHVDLDGSTADAHVAAAIAALRDRCSEVRVLGSYPAAP